MTRVVWDQTTRPNKEAIQSSKPVDLSLLGLLGRRGSSSLLPDLESASADTTVVQGV